MTISQLNLSHLFRHMYKNRKKKSSRDFEKEFTQQVGVLRIKSNHQTTFNCFEHKKVKQKQQSDNPTELKNLS